MDLQKHGFWLVLGGILALELGFLFLFVLPADGEVSKQSLAISSHMKKLKLMSSEGEIPNRGNISQALAARSEAAKGLLRSVLHLVAIDHQLLERRVATVETPQDIGPHFREEEGKIEQKLADGTAPYTGLRSMGKDDGAGGDSGAKINWPDKPNDPDEVPDFYRKWWVIKMMLDQVLGPVSKAAVDKSRDKKPWELYEISWKDGLEGDTGSYVHQYLQIRVLLNIRLTDLHKLFQGLVNTEFLVLPVKLQVKQAKPDPREIQIKVPYGEKDPDKKKLGEMASQQRPLVEVELTANVADLDREKLLDVARRFRKFVGGKKEVDAFMEALKEDKDFLKVFKVMSDKDKFLDTMKDELMKKP
ncbi:hypothetical protein JYT84_00520 [bacterium AH-315-M10]|nr:hypothetical protein [bacterium AH-315-M10]